MKKNIIELLLIMNNIIFISAQSVKTPIDYVNDNCMEKFRPDTLGCIRFNISCKTNLIYNTDGYMIHKNGGKWWYNQAKRKFPNDRGSKGKYLSHYTVCENLLKQDRDSIKNYNKWVFYIDEKYLEVKTEVHGETGEKYLSYYPKENKPLEVILYQRLVKDADWTEVERKKFNSDTEYYKNTWDVNFIKQKLAESNLKK